MEELAWSAGFIDGEGTFGVQRQSGRKDIMYLQATQVDRRVLDRLRDAMGLGKVYGPYQYNRPGYRNNKPYFYYRLTGDEKVVSAAKMLWPYLSEVKRLQFIEANTRMGG